MATQRRPAWRGFAVAPAIALLAAASLAHASPPLKMLVLDPLAARNACACAAGLAQRDYDGLARHLAPRLARQVTALYHKELPAAEADPLRPDILVAKYSEGLAYAGAVHRGYRPIASLTGTDGLVTQQGLFVVKGIDAAASIADLSGKRLVIGPASSEEKCRAALDALTEAGVQLQAPPTTALTCNAACLDVLDGKADVAAISAYALPLAMGCGAIPRGSLRIVGRTRPVPFVTLFVPTGTAPGVIASLRAALKSVAGNPVLLHRMESKSGFVDFALPAHRPSAAPGGGPNASSGWTEWRGGPARNGLVSFLPARLPDQPAVVWRVKLDSPGMGGVTATDTVVIVSDKSVDRSTDIWRCLSARDGHPIWEIRDPAPGKMEYGSGPRANAVISGNRVVLLGALGLLQAVDLATGKRLWQVDLPGRYRSAVPTWGFAGTPVVEGSRVVVATGSPAVGLAAFALDTGAEAWTARAGAPGYGSFIAATLGGHRQVVGHDATTLGGWDLSTGRRLWTLKPPQTHDFNVPTPLPALGGLVVATENNGTRLYSFAPTGVIKPTPVRLSMDLRPVTCTPLLVDGMLWGCADGGLCCLDAATFKTLWHSEEGSFLDHVNLVGAPDRILACTKDGKLALLPSRPTASTRPQFVTVVRPASPSDDVAVWSHPAVVGSRIYLRTQAEAICLDLGGN